MKKNLSNMLLREAVELCNKLDNFKISFIKHLDLTEDEKEFYRIMIPILEETNMKVQQKIEKDKAVNKKMLAIS